MKYIYFIMVFATLTSCEESNTFDACYSSEPLEDLKWLKNVKKQFDKDTTSYQQIVQYTYQDERVFLIDACPHCPDAMTYVYDCEENTVCIFGGMGGFNSCPDFVRNVTSEKVLYRE